MIVSTPKKNYLHAKTPTVSLTGISEPVLEIIRMKGPLTFVEVADDFIQNNVTNVDEHSKQEKNVRRRIYDVLNVLLACNMIVKDPENKKVKLFDRNLLLIKDKTFAYDEIFRRQTSRIEQKTQMLISKTRLLIYYRLLLERNRNSMRPTENVQMPTIILGYTDVENGKICRSLDGQTLTIISQYKPNFFSPENIFRRLSFPKEWQISVLSTMPKLAPFQKEIIQSITED